MIKTWQSDYSGRMKSSVVPSNNTAYTWHTLKAIATTFVTPSLECIRQQEPSFLLALLKRDNELSIALYNRTKINIWFCMNDTATLVITYIAASCHVVKNE